MFVNVRRTRSPWLQSRGLSRNCTNERLPSRASRRRRARSTKWWMDRLHPAGPAAKPSFSYSGLVWRCLAAPVAALFEFIKANVKKKKKKAVGCVVTKVEWTKAPITPYSCTVKHSNEDTLKVQKYFLEVLPSPPALTFSHPKDADNTIVTNKLKNISQHKHRRPQTKPSPTTLPAGLSAVPSEPPADMPADWSRCPRWKAYGAPQRMWTQQL